MLKLSSLVECTGVISPSAYIAGSSAGLIWLMMASDVVPNPTPPAINAKFVPCFLLQCPAPCLVLGRSFRPSREAADPTLENMEGIAGLICLYPSGEAWSAGVTLFLLLYLDFLFLLAMSDQIKYLVHQGHLAVRASLVASATFLNILLLRTPTYIKLLYSLCLL